MELIIQLIQQYNTYFLMGIIVLYLLLFILFIINQRKIKTLQKKYNYFMGNRRVVNSVFRESGGYFSWTRGFATKVF